MKNTFTTVAQFDNVMDLANDAPANYAKALTDLVAEGYADKLPMDVKGKPAGERADIINLIKAAYKAQGVTTDAALRQRALRLTYALHILNANPKRDEETEENYVKRVARIRAMANAGDRKQIDKALAGSTAPVKRGARNAGGTGKGKGKPAKVETPETPAKVETPADRFNAAQTELAKVLTEYMDALDAYRANGGKVTKAASSLITGKAQALIASLVA